MSAHTDRYLLENGVQIPKLGFGTWQIRVGDAAYRSVQSALRTGYQHVDTARAYGNESSVGQAVRDSGLARDEVFITSKLPAQVKSYEEAHQSFETTMSELGLDQLDLYLIHAPWPWDEIGKDCSEGNKQAWRAMEEIYRSGRVRAIGVSNFIVSDLKSLSETWEIKPMVNQIKFHIGYTEPDVTEFCQANNILVEAYSPLATGRILDSDTIAEMGRKYGKSVAQVCIRYALQKNTLPLPKSTHEQFIKENADVDFEISSDDMNYLDSLERTTSTTAMK